MTADIHLRAAFAGILLGVRRARTLLRRLLDLLDADRIAVDSEAADRLGSALNRALVLLDEILRALRIALNCADDALGRLSARLPPPVSTPPSDDGDAPPPLCRAVDLVGRAADVISTVRARVSDLRAALAAAGRPEVAPLLTEIRAAAADAILTLGGVEGYVTAAREAAGSEFRMGPPRDRVRWGERLHRGPVR